MPNIPKRTALSLIELLVVLTIMGIMVALLMPAVHRAWNTANNMDARDDLRQIALAYLNYTAKMVDVGPDSQERLSPYYENSSRINEALDTKRITVIWNIPGHAIDSDTVLAYETHLDRLGHRLVAMGDATVRTRDK
ncbi:MAG TPA: type II secretion system protein [Gemmataceae bacterium]|jgi:prepilin-type N-terminal cleavage/methylation domain-containing protein|nr:type II secretion system protein [Gemmataceae bacterium]